MIYWIDNRGPGKLGVMARPRGGDWLGDEIANLRGEGVDLVISLLEIPEISELELLTEEALCAVHDIEYRSFPIPDRGVPDSVEGYLQLVEDIDSLLKGGRNVVIHCRAGIGRSSMVAAGVLCRQGVSTLEAFDLVEQARGLKVPDTPEQINWVRIACEDRARSAGAAIL